MEGVGERCRPPVPSPSPPSAPPRLLLLDSDSNTKAKAERSQAKWGEIALLLVCVPVLRC